VLESGGLHIIGTERHESRRIDNQLRGRAGRQGDPGASRFYLSLEDSLMRIFASERVSSLMQKLGMEEGEAIEHPWVTKAIENAQRKVEGHNFDIRKHLLEYDDVANDQRKVVYQKRTELMEAESVKDDVGELRDEIIPAVVNTFIPPGSMEEMWDLDGLKTELESITNESFDVKSWLEENPDIPEEEITQRIIDHLAAAYDEKEKAAGEEGLRRFEKYVLLQSLDEHWKEHLAGMDYLRQSVGLRGYAQKNPKQEYKREAYELFGRMLDEYKTGVVSVLSKVQVRDPEQVEQAAQEAQPIPTEVTYHHQEAESALSDVAGEESEAPAQVAIAAAAAQRDAAMQRANQRPVQAEDQPAPFKRDHPKIGRNDPCHCGSGKKYKQCHGKIT